MNNSTGAQLNQISAVKIPIRAFGLALSLFGLISYLLCIAGYLLLPGLQIGHQSLSIFLPGFDLLSWKGFFVGLVESFAYGWYIALVFGSLFNFFGARQ